MPDVLSESDQVRAQELGQIMGNSLGGAFLHPPSTSVRVCQHITVQLYQMPHLAQGTYLNPCQTEVKPVVLPSILLFSTLSPDWVQPDCSFSCPALYVSLKAAFRWR